MCDDDYYDDSDYYDDYYEDSDYHEEYDRDYDHDYHDHHPHHYYDEDRRYYGRSRTVNYTPTYYNPQPKNNKNNETNYLSWICGGLCCCFGAYIIILLLA